MEGRPHPRRDLHEPLNVHVNRAPLSGTVTSVEHIPGGFVPAFNKESENNERVVWHFDTELGDIEMIQIAGAVARRIVPYVPSGTKVEQGERIGLIRFGSRVDIYLPEAWRWRSRSARRPWLG